jgi:ornithine carbamoyltransferase
MSKKDFISLADFSKAELTEIIDAALKLKKDPYNSHLKNKQIGLIFQKNSTRTRISFEVAINEMGGDAIILNSNEMQLGRGETIADTAKVLSRYLDAIMIRANQHDDLLELAKHASIPVINGLTNYNHPCQIMADLLTLYEKLGSLDNKIICYIGDGNNICNSWLNAADKFKFQLNLALKENFYPDKNLLHKLTKQGLVKIFSDPKLAAKNADLVTTDTFVSMGDKNSSERLQIFKDFKVNKEIMGHAKKEAIFMHCLPAHRGEEVDIEVIDGKQSVIFDEAENRLHIQKAILNFIIK